MSKTGNERTNVTLKRVRVTIVAAERVCVSVALVIQHAKRVRRIMLTSVVCLTLPSPSILPQKRQYFGEKLLNIQCVFFLYSCVWKISHYRRNTERYCHKFARYSCQILMILQFSRHIFEKCFNIKFRENPSSGSRCVPCGRKGGRTDMTKLIFAFRNFANTPKRTLSKPTQYGPVSNIFCRLIMVKNTCG
jgi:hypothetical protein